MYVSLCVVTVSRLAPCCAVMCCAVLCYAVMCCAVLCGAVLCCAVLCCAVLCGAVRCCAVRYGAVRCGAVRCGAVRCGAVLCGAVRCGAVRCGAYPEIGHHRPLRLVPRDLCGRERARQRWGLRGFCGRAWLGLGGGLRAARDLKRGRLGPLHRARSHSRANTQPTGSFSGDGRI